MAKTETEQLIADHDIQHDNSGQGHNWQPVGDDLPADIAEEIATWIIEDQPESGDEYWASNGQSYQRA